MKYILILADGMADWPVPSLGGKTPLETAQLPNVNALARKGTVGLVQTVPEGIAPGSDVANLSVLGYDPKECYTGRSPLEAISIGVPLAEEDVTFRANVVTLSEDEPYAEKTMIDYSSDEITTEEARELIASLKEAFDNDTLMLHSGISYRHLLVWHGGVLGTDLTPPHDISDRKVTDYLPKGEGAEVLLPLMEKSYEILKNHPVNEARRARGLRPANSLWLWGAGTKPRLQNFTEKTGHHGTMISAVDLLKGIALGSGMESIDVPGATGNIDTNFKGKAEAALDAFSRGQDFVYLHMEAPDECGHRGEAENKVKSLELIDREVVGPIWEALKKSGEPFKLLFMPDHPTPLEIRTHVRDAVPFLLYDSEGTDAPFGRAYTEANAKESGIFVEKGHTLLDEFLKSKSKF